MARQDSYGRRSVHTIGEVVRCRGSAGVKRLPVRVLYSGSEDGVYRPYGQAPRALAPVMSPKTHEERRATEPLTPSLYGRDWRNGKEQKRCIADKQAKTGHAH